MNFDHYTQRQEQANLENIREIKLHQLRVTQLALSSVNARPIRNKTNSFQQYITENNIDLCVITETWIKETDDINLTNEIPPMGYNIISHPCKTGKQGGGLALTYRNTIKLQDKTDNTRNYETMEHSNFDILFPGTKINLHLAYKIPSASVLKFCEELTDILEDCIRSDTGRIVFTGDFNIHVDEPQDSDTVTNIQQFPR